MSDIKKVTTEELLVEIAERKKVEVPALVESVNSGIQKLIALGCEIEDEYNPDYRLVKVEINPSGVIEYFTKEV